MSIWIGIQAFPKHGILYGSSKDLLQAPYVLLSSVDSLFAFKFQFSLYQYCNDSSVFVSPFPPDEYNHYQVLMDKDYLSIQAQFLQ